MIQIVSIDIGYRDFSQYVEKFLASDIIELESIYKNLPIENRRKTRGPMNSQVEKLLLQTALCGKRVSTGVYDFATQAGDGLTIKTRLELLSHLDKFKYLWDETDIFVIEQQYFNTSFGSRRQKSSTSGANVDAIKIAESVFMWFLERYPFKSIHYFGSQFKTQIFGAPLKMTKPQRKNWSVIQSKKLYTLRNDEDMINIFNLSEAVKRKQIKTEEKVSSFKDQFPCKSDDAIELSDQIIRKKQKLDDVSDSFMQCQAFKFKTMVACF